MKFPIIIFLLLSCFCANVSAEEILTWEDCVREARISNSDLASAREKVNQAKANKQITTANILPQIISDMSGKRSKTAAAKNQTDSYSYGISGQQLIFDGFKTPYDIRTALENQRAAQYDYGVVSSNVRLRLAIAFTELLRAQEFLYIAEDIAGRRRKNADLLKLRYEAGREHRGSLLTVQADLAQAEFDVTVARRNIDLAQRRLNKELGWTNLRPIKASGDFKITHPSREKPDFEKLAESNPFLQELITKKEAARFGVKSAQADFFPAVYANASYGKTDSFLLPHSEEWSFGANISFPIFEGGKRIAELSKSKAVFNQTRADEKSGRESVIFTLEETWTELQDAIDRIDVQQKFLEAAEERAKITQAQYSNGLVSFDNWIIIEDNLVGVRKSFLNAQAGALISEAAWLQAKGETLNED